MKQPDLSLTPPSFTQDPAATQQLSALIAKLEDILKDIYDKLGTVEIVSSAPAVTELQVVGDGKGGTLSEVKLLDDATQTNRKLYYKNSAGTLRLIDSA